MFRARTVAAGALSCLVVAGLGIYSGMTGLLSWEDSFPLILRQSFEHFHFFAEKGLLSDKNGIMCKVSVAPAPAVARANEAVRWRRCRHKISPELDITNHCTAD